MRSWPSQNSHHSQYGREESTCSTSSLYMCKIAQGLSLCFFCKCRPMSCSRKPHCAKKRLAFKYARGHCRQNYDHNLHMHSFVREIVISTRYIEKFEQNLFVFSTLIHTYLQKKLRSTLLRFWFEKLIYVVFLLVSHMKKDKSKYLMKILVYKIVI